LIATIPIWNAESASELEIMVGRLKSLVWADTLTENDFVELTTIFDNIAYMFLYLDSNMAYVDASAIEPFREEIFVNPQLDQQMEAQLRSHCFPSPEVEEARQLILANITSKSSAKETKLINIVQTANVTLAAMEQARSDFLARLGASTGSGSTAAQFYRLQAETSDSSRRVRLQQAWVQTSRQSNQELSRNIDRLVAHRWSTQNTEGSVIAADLRRSRLSIPTVWDFITAYLQKSIQDHGDLKQEVLTATGSDSGGLDEHFGRFLTTRYEEIPILKFDLGKCLSYLLHTLDRSYNLTFHEIPSPYSSIRILQVTRCGTNVGSIHLDLWNRTGKDANITLAARNRLDWNNKRQQPVARISCRFNGNESGVISFQNVHSLLHEAGHAVNHLLMVNRIPSTSGLDYLPIERLEHMSMWHEKWVFHVDAKRFLCTDDSQQKGLGACQDSIS
jgi:oligopeptidase A